MRYKRDLMCAGPGKRGSLRILAAAAERPLLSFRFSCPHCHATQRQNLMNFLLGPDDWIKQGPSLLYCFCRRCWNGYTEEAKRAAREHLANLKVSHPELAQRLIAFHHSWFARQNPGAGPV